MTGELECSDIDHPNWKRTLGTIQKKQSTIRNEKIIGMLLMNLGAM